ncbi:MarR family winged helix-turn-helix transcriptional regulator [Hyphobacterium sp.]|uniref:MarR family winged helix-turn-helix transcriptional regulator n=1 Tax=Hyphobacterium sp. TaxID=2004662 RepID=UPI003BAB19C6
MQARTRARLLTRYLESALKPVNLTPEQFSLLAAIAADRTQNLKTMAQKTGHDVSTLSRTLSVIIRDGLVLSAPHPDDKRRKDLRLTVRGEIRLEEAMKLWRQSIDALPKGDEVGERNL